MKRAEDVMRILVADDEQTARLLLSGLLSKMGHEVVLTTNGREALDVLLARDAPPMAILDWKMPLLHGVDVLRRIRAVEQTTPAYIIMLSSKSASADVIEGLQAGANNYLFKPFCAEELLAHVEAGRRMLQVEQALAARNVELENALAHIKTLRGIIPICSACKKIRDDQGYWSRVEEYVSTHTEAQFTHGICPDCSRRLYPEYHEDSDFE
ncbi:MAG: response regulator transcription factor [Kiritimatiellia bacterium]